MCCLHGWLPVHAWARVEAPSVWDEIGYNKEGRYFSRLRYNYRFFLWKRKCIFIPIVFKMQVLLVVWEFVRYIILPGLYGIDISPHLFLYTFLTICRIERKLLLKLGLVLCMYRPIYIRSTYRLMYHSISRLNLYFRMLWWTVKVSIVFKCGIAYI